MLPDAIAYAVILNKYRLMNTASYNVNRLKMFKWIFALARNYSTTYICVGS